MPAYVIAEIDIHDSEQYERYKAASPDAVHGGGGRFVVGAASSRCSRATGDRRGS